MMSKPRYVIDDNGCWVWQRAMTSGYGKLVHKGKSWRAHRWYYVQAKGPIPEGLQLDHLCRNRACVNPEHLEAVTHAENGRRGRSTRLTAEQAAEIRESTETCGVVGARSGVSASHVLRIRNGEKWNVDEGHDPGPPQARRAPDGALLVPSGITVYTTAPDVPEEGCLTRQSVRLPAESVTETELHWKWFSNYWRWVDRTDLPEGGGTE